ncbi:alpha/beta hydrolase [Marivibrio halodurans]|nr:alpha/beta hydrolase [Marivibrio halodurans]
MMWILGVIVIAYGAVLAGLYVGQRGLMYHPAAGAPQPPSVVGVPEMTVLRIPSHDGLTLRAWWAPPAGTGRPVLLYFHGNAGDLDDRAGRARFFLDRGYGLLLMSYRYNGGSGGSPGESALIADGHAAADWLAAEHGIGADRIVLYGESLGSGIASALAAEGRGRTLIVEGGFDSAANVAQGHYPYVPAKWLIKDRFDSAGRLAKAHGVAKLFVHGARDRIIPLARARALHEAAAGPKRLEIQAEGGHSDLYDHGMGALVAAFLEAHYPTPSPDDR